MLSLSSAFFYFIFYFLCLKSFLPFCRQITLFFTGEYDCITNCCSSFKAASLSSPHFEQFCYWCLTGFLLRELPQSKWTSMSFRALSPSSGDLIGCHTPGEISEKTPACPGSCRSHAVCFFFFFFSLKCFTFPKGINLTLGNSQAFCLSEKKPVRELNPTELVLFCIFIVLE